MNKHVIYCEKCINPMGFGVINPLTNQELKFFETRNGVICEICNDLQMSQNLPPRNTFDKEFEIFLSTRDEILFAYSGGLDSTVVLYKLVEECKKKNILLRTFTIETGVKGIVAKQNIENVLQDLKIGDQHVFIDASNLIQNNSKIIDITGKAMTTLAVYKRCLENNILPCGKICNSMLDGIYDSLMNELGFDVMVTGGDTPKKNIQGLYSLYWKKPSGITILRGGYAFGLTKRINAEYIEGKRIPWTHPLCGGYDTDCLIPGVYFAKQFNHKACQDVETIVLKYSIILDYLSERVRFGIIDRNDGINMLTRIEIANSKCEQELKNIFRL